MCFNLRWRREVCWILAVVIVSGLACAPRQIAVRQRRAVAASTVREEVRRRYAKREYRIPMRDGATLFTAVYTPKGTSQAYPIMMLRTPYGVRPYGQSSYPDTLGPSEHFMRDGYIFVYQDVRGRYMSEGDFRNMTPHLAEKTSADVDESTDTYDTITWLLDNIDNHNGRVGMWGISYPGFYAAAGMIDAHPALVAVSPQAPIADWFFDDFHHHGAFFLPHGFNFISIFGMPRAGLNTDDWKRFDHGTPDGYQFFTDLGPLSNANDRYLHGANPAWNNVVEHPNYDSFWQSRNILPHLNNVAPAIMTVGGLFDAEDLYGPLNIYRSIEAKNPEVFNILVMGPWRHGGWAREAGRRLGNIDFGAERSPPFQLDVEFPFFNHFLKDEGELDFPEAYVFETGVNRWRSFDRWPPALAEEKFLHLRENEALSFDPSDAAAVAFDEYISDPNRPVPFTEEFTTGMTREYMTDDQRFASRRSDVLTYQTEVLDHDVTLAGPIAAELWCSTSGSASDWIVKIIDVYPADAPDPDEFAVTRPLGGYQMMVRSEVLRGRFRNSYEHPEPFVPNEPTRVVVPLQDVLHTFREGHRIMVQIQSTWFPLVDRNPQKYVDNIFEAREEDFIKTTQRVYRNREYPSCLRVGVLTRVQK